MVQKINALDPTAIEDHSHVSNLINRAIRQGNLAGRKGLALYYSNRVAKDGGVIIGYCVSRISKSLSPVIK